MRNRARTPLSKAKVRQSWSKYNLYNLSRLTTSSYKTRNFFQQKWDAKAALRAYHSEQVREGMWERMFSRRLRSVVPMNPEKMARNDGSLESAGRGSGLEEADGARRPKPIPYMQMTFAPLERRLDTAIFRALFASSARQARQFVVHGAVKVNGKKMKHPGYLLNPGDMFQVDPERVMFATGAPKELSDRTSSDNVEDPPSEGEEGNAASEEQAEKTKEEDEEEEDPRKVLKSLLVQAKSILANSKDAKLSAHRKQDLRAFQKQIKRQLSRSPSSTIMTDSLEAQFDALKSRLMMIPKTTDDNNNHPSEAPSITPSASASASATPADASASSSSPPQQHQPAQRPTSPPQENSPEPLTDTDLSLLQSAFTRLHSNPYDPTKPYATPWTPRPYMSAFAFIPRYLEVNQNICAAVYLRHPVARPGMAEVPTPYGENYGGNAFAWYLRRR